MRALRVAGATAMICVSLAGCGAKGASPAAPPGQVPAATRQVSFEVKGTTTYGTLEVPAHRSDQHLAAALLVAGSGPTDRDGNQPPTLTPNTLKQIADALSGMGIMSLRFDKYFTGRTGGGGYAAHPATIDVDAYIQQADDAYKELAEQSVADRQRLLVVGHSEGGLFAMLIAETVTPHPAGLALAEPQDERLLDLLAVQINESLDSQVAQGAITADTARANAQGARQAISQFRAGQPVDTTGLLPSVVGILTPVILTPATAVSARTDDAIDPASYAAKLPAGLRVLVTDGSADTNVPPFTIGPLVTALHQAAITGPGLQTLPGIDHDLNPAGTQPSGAPIDPSFLAALKAWAQPFSSAA